MVCRLLSFSTERRDNGVSNPGTAPPNSNDSHQPRAFDSESVSGTSSSSPSNTLKPQSPTALHTQQGNDTNPHSLALQTIGDTSPVPLSAAPVPPLNAGMLFTWELVPLLTYPFKYRVPQETVPYKTRPACQSHPILKGLRTTSGSADDATTPLLTIPKNT